MERNEAFIVIKLDDVTVEEADEALNSILDQLATDGKFLAVDGWVDA